MKFTHEEALKFTKGSVALLVAWPPPTNTSRKKLFFLDVYFGASFLCAQAMLLLLLNGMYVHRNNFEIMIQSMCFAITIIQMSIKMMTCRMQRSNLQLIIMEMENIVKQAAPYEKVILEKYVKRCAILHISLTFGFYLAGTNIVLGPIFLSQSLPTFAVYPFDTESHPIYEIIYFQQSLTALQACTAAAIDCQAALLLWFAGARFEMLEIELANIVDEYDLKRCIQKHRHILSYAEKIVKTVRFVIFATVGITTILIVFSGVLLLFTDSMTIKFQFFILDIVAIIQLFLNSHPAENLIQMSTAIGSAAYDLNWIDKSLEIWKNVCFLIQRSQKPITVSIAGFIPALSLTYYMSVALLLWFAGARFEMLEIELANTVDEYDLKRCIVKHGQILSYAGKIVKTVRFVILSTVCITTILIVFSGLLLLFSDSVAVKFQFLVLDIVAIVQLFLNSYPAENLIEMSTAIGSAAYDLSWIDKSRKIWRNVCFLIQRSQKPITISIPGFIPALSLTYYMSFLSSSFSYFTTLRAAVK
ncbi:odorant receptor 30a-like [Vespa velutina]|uniref:odorant receptor 30a-like n=1 Tax=Vespa velutina TaxID=202808 RepID=UPI001FB5125D|nr:odorant receptor 30a-like [Vespa velutina]